VSNSLFVALSASDTSDVTDIAFGTMIQCPSCENITWRPEFKPRWYFRLRNFVFSNLVSFNLGVLASLLATCISQHYAQPYAVSPITHQSQQTISKKL
jgi:hypothetical protein